MTFRTVTLTAVAALSLGMAASQVQAQAQTITVPLNEPGTAAPAQTGPGTVVTRGSDGVTTVDTVGGVPADEVAAPAGATLSAHTTRAARARRAAAKIRW